MVAFSRRNSNTAHVKKSLRRELNDVFSSRPLRDEELLAAMEEAYGAPRETKRRPSSRIVIPRAIVGVEEAVSVVRETLAIAEECAPADALRPMFSIDEPAEEDKKRSYICVRKSCAFIWHEWLATCPMCTTGVMRLLTPEVATKLVGSPDNVPVNILQVSSANTKRITTGVPALDAVLGPEGKHGYPHVSYAAIAGEPGAGKSTLLSSVVAHSGFKKILCVTSEEHLSNVRERWERMGLGDVGDKVKFMNEPNIDLVEDYLRSMKPDLFICDSANEMISEKHQWPSGSRKQLSYIMREMRDKILKPMNCSGIFVCQFNKKGVFAGPKFIEHLVDIVLLVAGERTSRTKYVYALKNRQGPVGITAYFRMENSGMVGIEVREGPPPKPGKEEELDEDDAPLGSRTFEEYDEEENKKARRGRPRRKPLLDLG